MIFIHLEEAQHAEFPKAFEGAIISTNCNKKMNNLEFHFRFVKAASSLGFVRSSEYIHAASVVAIAV